MSVCNDTRSSCFIAFSRNWVLTRSAEINGKLTRIAQHWEKQLIDTLQRPWIGRGLLGYAIPRRGVREHPQRDLEPTPGSIDDVDSRVSAPGCTG